MASEQPAVSGVPWVKALLNGVVATVIGFVLYIIPGLVVGIQMGIDLGPQLQDNAEVSRQINEAVTGMYRSSVILWIAYAVIVAALVFWRAKVVAKKAGGNGVLSGVLVGVVPAVVTVLFALLGSWGIRSFFEAAAFLVVGGLAGKQRRL